MLVSRKDLSCLADDVIPVAVLYSVFLSFRAGVIFQFYYNSLTMSRQQSPQYFL